MTKRFAGIKVGIIGALLIGALSIGTAFAAGPGTGYGYGMANNGTTTTYCGIGFGKNIANGARGMVETVAKVLGMSVTDIQTQRQSGKSIVQIAESKNVSKDTVVNAVIEARKAQLAELVAQGKITQAQADLAIGNMTQRVSANMERTSVGPNGNGQGRKGQAANGRSAGPRGNSYRFQVPAKGQ
ncbi:MAG: hypothetical protein M1299_10735 [Firmicutes bacterium]|nr:hypothetical protein [Bacillota bacterium]MCL5040280.1 hypothetical protein [Bacillota bacterium]